MTISVHPPSKRTLTSFDTKFALQRDNWNDRSFMTLYHLHYASPEDGEVKLIGGVKILRRGQTTGDPQLVREAFETLGPDFCSVGTSLDYYQRLNEIPAKDRREIMKALNDVVARPELVPEFSTEEGWRISLFRDNSDWPEFLADSTVLINGSFGALPDMDEAFSFAPANSKTEILLDFSAPATFGYMGQWRRQGPSGIRVLLPERMIVLIGRNGSGKSTLLARLAHVAFASPQERATDKLKSLGAFNPASIGFMRIITISYSAFDSFTVPGTDSKDKRQIVRDIEKGDGRFVYCGLRDIAAEVQQDLDDAETAEDLEVANLPPAPSDRRSTTKLKSVDALASEFAALLLRIRDVGKQDLLLAALAPLLQDPSFADLRDQVDELLGENAQSIFLEWSTGHKIALHVVASLVANATRKSLILFDEPEMHLHPPLMAALMHSVRLVLNEINAFCIVATHSPVLLQETLARHVRIVRRVGDELIVKTPKLETFGENVGILTYDTFGLTASTTDFHKVLDLLIDGYDTFEEINALFTPGLSGQARGYVVSRLAPEQSEQ